MHLTWSWLAAPYLVCLAALAVLGGITVLVRGDRVMRLGVIGCVATTMPWAICTALVACIDDPALATRLLRLGNGPVAMIGPCLLLVLLGGTGQLERHRWVARIAGLAGATMMGLCWGTTWTVPGVHRLSSGMFYINAGVLTPIHISQLGVWLAVGLFIARQTSTNQARRRTSQLVLAILIAGTVGATDLLLVYGVWGSYPIAWVPTLVACFVALHLVIRGDLLRSQGVDRDTVLELGTFAGSGLVVASLVVALDGAPPFALAAATSAVWVVGLAGAWSVTARRRPPVHDSAALEDLVAGIADQQDERAIAAALAATWRTFGISELAMWRAHGNVLQRVDGDPAATPAPWPLDAELVDWLVTYGESIAAGDLATMRLGANRPAVEALVAAHGATLIVPLLDRGALVGLCEGTHAHALRDVERGLVSESALAVGRALTFIRLAAAAEREGENAREVEVAEAMRLQASRSVASGDDLGRWAVSAEYRSATRTTSASWSSALLPDGRLALIVTEAQAHGVPAALATAALTGAFAAATSVTAGALDLDALLASLHASSEGVVRGGEPVAAFIALLDHATGTIAWACAGHPGAVVVAGDPGPMSPADLATGSGDHARPTYATLGGGGQRAGASLATATRGTLAMPLDATIVVASSELRDDDDLRWQLRLFEVAGSGGRMAPLLVERAYQRAGERPTEDLLAVVVRIRK
ncbi:MAG: SpoIIE family protein phosphatase [Proteobacteria bacterium]|nr:SpoIIE family protein phosphatase [Pseudomonadota bacterium]